RDSITQTVFLADSNCQTRIQKAAAEHVIGEYECRVICIVAAEDQPDSRHERRILFIWCFDAAVYRGDFLIRMRDMLGRARALPRTEEFIRQSLDRRRVEIADD